MNFSVIEIHCQKDLFDGFDEEIIKNNFSTIYNMADDCCDFGYPQTTQVYQSSKKVYLFFNLLSSLQERTDGNNGPNNWCSLMACE